MPTTRTLTAAWLRRHGACAPAVRAFQRRWPRGVRLRGSQPKIPRALVAYLEWLADHLPAAARAEYARVTAAAWAKYDRVTEAARAEYARVTAPARAEYARVTEAALWALLCQHGLPATAGEGA